MRLMTSLQNNIHSLQILLSAFSAVLNNSLFLLKYVRGYFDPLCLLYTYVYL